MYQTGSAYLEQIFVDTARALAGGQKPKVATQILIDRGIPADAARQLVSRAQQAVHRARREQGQQRMLYGLGLLGAAIVITAGSYYFAAYVSLSGGTYVVATGMFFVGAWQLLSGLYRTIAG